MLKSLRNGRLWKAFDMRARVWPAWFDLIEMRATGKFDMRARAARVASWDRDMEKASVSS